MSLKSDFMSIFPTALDEMNIQPWSMTFKGQEEQQYWNSRLDKELSQKRVGIVIGVLLFLLLGVSDWLLMPEMKNLTWFFRFAVFMPLSLIAFIMSYLSFAKKLLVPMATGILFLAGASQILVVLKAPIDVVRSYQMVMAILAIYGFTIMRTNFVYTLGAMLATFLCYGSFIFTLSPIKGMERFTSLLIMLVCYLVTACGGYMLEYAQRRNYFLSIGRGSGPLDQVDPKGKGKAKEVNVVQQAQTVVKTVESPVNKIFENLSDMVWFISVEGNIKYISPAVKEFLGYEAEDLVGKRAVSIMTSDAYTSFDEMGARLYRDKNRIQATFDYKTKAGIIKSGDVVMKRFTDKRYGEGYIGTTRPAVEVVQPVVDAASKAQDADKKAKAQASAKAADSRAMALLEAQIAELKADIEDQKSVNRGIVQEKDDLLAKFARLHEEQENKSELSHEHLAEILERMAAHYAQMTQAQLNAHYKEIEIIQDKFMHQNMSKHDLENYLKAGKSKIALTANSLDLLRDRVGLFKSYLMPVEHGHVEEYQMRTLLEESVLKLKNFFKGTKHIIEIDCSRSVMIETDKRLFEQVINNMIMHSLQFSFLHIRNGKIDISVELVDAQVFITYRDNGDKLESDVIDEMFARMVHPELEDLEGLELHLVRKIVEKHLNGSIGCDYDLSENTFRLVMPAKR